MEPVVQASILGPVPRLSGSSPNRPARKLGRADSVPSPNLGLFRSYFVDNLKQARFNRMILGKYVGFWVGIDHDRFKIRSPVMAKVGQGVGVMLVSQKISDFDPAMRSAMNTSILFRSKYEGDLKA
jgi:hypothetical protein